MAGEGIYTIIPSLASFVLHIKKKKNETKKKLYLHSITWNAYGFITLHNLKQSWGQP